MEVICTILTPFKGFPGISTGKESTCNAGGPGSTPGWGRSPGEEVGYPLQYSGASLAAQLVKNPSAMWESWDLIPALGRFPGEGNSYPLQYSSLENSLGSQSPTQLNDFHSVFIKDRGKLYVLFLHLLSLYLLDLSKKQMEVLCTILTSFKFESILK